MAPSRLTSIICRNSSAATVRFGGLKGEVAYDDHAFGIDPDIQRMFYGPEHSQPDEAGPSGEAGRAAGDAAP
jgi:hypothetical protein